MNLNITFGILDCCLHLWYSSVLYSAKSECLGERFDIFSNLTSMKWEVLEMHNFCL